MCAYEAADAHGGAALLGSLHGGSHAARAVAAALDGLPRTGRTPPLRGGSPNYLLTFRYPDGVHRTVLDAADGVSDHDLVTDGHLAWIEVTPTVRAALAKEQLVP